MFDVAAVTRDVVVPAVTSVLLPGEVDDIVVRRTEALEGSVELVLTVRGETYRDVVAQGCAPAMSTSEWRERLRSNLADFVSESRFGWGQDRGV